jgi:hypothetical protein
MSQRVRTRVITAGVIIVVFGAGILVGLVADDDLGASASPPDVTEVTEESGSNERSNRCCIYHQVDPNESQLARIDSIRQVYRDRTNALYDELKAEYPDRFWAILLDTRNAIKSVMTPEQAAEYQRLLDEYDAEKAREAEAGGESGDDSR